jgi:hypothetical protein
MALTKSQSNAINSTRANQAIREGSVNSKDSRLPISKIHLLFYIAAFICRQRIAVSKSRRGDKLRMPQSKDRKDEAGRTGSVADDSQAPDAAAPGKGRTQKYLGELGLIALITLLSAFVPLSTDLYLPALPGMAKYFGVSADLANLTLILFFVFFSAGMLFWGPLSEYVFSSLVRSFKST